MARPRSFNDTAVLDAAAAEFRVHGFADTSTEGICEAAGVQRSSLYNAFISKGELYVRALERYVAVARERHVRILDNSHLSGAERLQLLMESVVEEECAAREEGHAAGCMVVHSRMNPDLRERDERVTRILDADLNATVSLIERTIQAGRVDGSIHADVNPYEGALLVATLISGMRVTAQTGVESGLLRKIALGGLRSLVS
ncbi:TetR/AcrR family transcriptional regulator [Streptomyces mirabilis]|uniref:TetR/AcrR family transcriptional regulator n=1 Tax=Streptomyces mirabilis TaxID=68239 RepID=UPI0033FF784D